MARGLLQRINTRARGAIKGDASADRAILDHLRSLLNSRQGNSALDPEYGVPDFVDQIHNFPGGLLELQRSLQRTIARYEPRLTAISVRPQRVAIDTLTLHFEISAALAASPKQVIRFTTQVTRGGHVRIV